LRRDGNNRKNPNEACKNDLNEVCNKCGSAELLAKPEEVSKLWIELAQKMLFV